MITYVSGNDTFSKNKYLNQLVNDHERVEFDLATADLGYVLSELLVIDLFATAKAYLIYNFKGFSNTSEKYNRTDTALLKQIFNCEEDLIVVGDKEINQRTTWFKQYQDKLQIKDFTLEEFDYDQEIRKHLSANNIKITPSALEALNANFQGNIFGATNDLNKLWEYTDHQQITEEDVHRAGQQLIEHKVFELYNQILRGQTKTALNYLSRLRQEGLADSDILLISFTQFTRMYEIKLYLGKGLNEFQIAKEMKVSPFVVKQSRKLVSHISEGRLESIILKIAEYDFMFKSGQVSPEKLNDLMVIL